MNPLLEWLERNGQNGELTNPDQLPEEVDERVYLTVLLGYKNELKEAEQERRGLDRDAKLPKIDVDNVEDAIVAEDDRDEVVLE